MPIKIPKGKFDKGFGGRSGIIIALNGTEGDRYEVSMYPLIINGQKQSPMKHLASYCPGDPGIVKFVTDKDTLVMIIMGDLVQIDWVPTRAERKDLKRKSK